MLVQSETWEEQWGGVWASARRAPGPTQALPVPKWPKRGRGESRGGSLLAQSGSGKVAGCSRFSAKRRRAVRAAPSRALVTEKGLFPLRGAMRRDPLESQVFCQRPGGLSCSLGAAPQAACRGWARSPRELRRRWAWRVPGAAREETTSPVGTSPKLPFPAKTSSEEDKTGLLPREVAGLVQAQGALTSVVL